LERHSCDNAKIAELLAIAGDSARPPLTKAFRRASRRAFLWPEEAAALVQEGRSLTELPGIGPYLDKTIRRWINDPPETPKPPEMRKGFLTLMQARGIISKKRAWSKELKGDLQMHSEWSDGSSPIRDMAAEADRRGYEYIAITDHAKGLKIAGGIDEKQLKQQAREIAAVNSEMNTLDKPLCVLRSIELNLNPRGEGDMDSHAAY
jgi:putative hydrolase